MNPMQEQDEKFFLNLNFLKTKFSRDLGGWNRTCRFREVWVWKMNFFQWWGLFWFLGLTGFRCREQSVLFFYRIPLYKCCFSIETMLEKTEPVVSETIEFENRYNSKEVFFGKFRRSGIKHKDHNEWFLSQNLSYKYEFFD